LQKAGLRAAVSCNTYHGRLSGQNSIIALQGSRLNMVQPRIFMKLELNRKPMSPPRLFWYLPEVLYSLEKD
tara:strand:- start:75 stop:287 length:213 start_codon:yes stop_codon:yes gene_type:complete